MEEFQSQIDAFAEQIEQELRDGVLSFPTVFDLSLRIKMLADDPDSSLTDIANAVKNAREMALLPYTKRVAQTRAGRPPRDGDDRRERGPRRDEAAAAEADVEATVTVDESTDGADEVEA